MILSPHAQAEMEKAGISPQEIAQCLSEGTPGIRQLIRGEMRYTKELDQQSRTIVVVYTYAQSDTRVITAYAKRRKKWH